MSDSPSRFGSITSTTATSYGWPIAASKPDFAVGEPVDGKAGLAQAALDKPGDRVVVFDEERAHRYSDVVRASALHGPPEGCILLKA